MKIVMRTNSGFYLFADWEVDPQHCRFKKRPTKYDW